MGRIPTPEHEHIEYLEAELEKLRDELGEARAIIYRDRKRIQQLNARNYVTSSSHLHAWRIRKLESCMDQLQHHFEGILSTKRWRFGDMIACALKGDFRRTQKPAAQLQAQQLFKEFESWKQISPDPGSLVPGRGGNRQIPVIHLMKQLENDILALSKSNRYRTGNAVVRSFGLVLFRGRPRLAMDHMLELLQACRSARNQEGGISPERTLQLIEQLQDVFESFLNSVRWRLGNNLIGGLQAVLLREKKPMATDHILELFGDFERGRYVIPGLQPRKLVFEENYIAATKAYVFDSTEKP